MPINTNFNVNPYFDDFDETKKFLRLLFKPGYAVQARELTQIQSLLQNQIQRQGDFVFKNGSLVSGGSIVNATATYLNLAPVYVETNIVANNFVDQTILSVDESKRAKVIKVYDADVGTGDPITLMIQQVFGDPFVAGETIKTNEVTPYFANTNNVGNGTIVSVDAGVYYYEGYFIETDKQTVAVSKYNTATANARIGYEITESIVEASADTSLLDPAQEASNYQAPGADRFKIDLILSTRSLDSVDDERFIQLQEVKESVLTENYQETQLSVLGKVLEDRTYDESGNYTVNPFMVSCEDNASNSAQTDIIISPGLAYVYGKKFKTISPTVITVDKPRQYINVTNETITMDFGYFLYSNNHFGSFPINTLQTVDLHCVNVASINVANTAMIANTRVGSARIKQVAFDNSSNTSNSATYEYRTYLFDLQVNDNVVSNIVSTTNLTTGSNVVIHGSLLSPIVDAYKGAKFRISSGLGSNEKAKTITGWNPTTKTLTLNQGWPTVSTPNTASVGCIDFEIGQIKSLVNFNGTSRVCSADVAQGSKDPSFTYDTTYIADSGFEPLIMRVKNSYIKQNTIADFTYSYRRLYEGQTFSTGVSPALSVGTGESLSGASSVSSILDQYEVICTSAGGSSYTAGQIIPASAITVNTSTRQITVSGGASMTANIVATIDASNPAVKPKIYYPANNTIQSTGGVDVFSNSAAVLYPFAGQIHIANTFINRVSDGVNSLYCSDVIELTKILDFRGFAITEANVSSAVDVTAKYFFDNGQRNSVYDHASIRLKPKYTPPQGPIAVFFNRFYSSGPGFFTVDSYTANNITNFDYGDIPVYIAPNLNNTNPVYELRDCVDFRPVRSDATAGSGSTVVFDVSSSTTGPKIPVVGSEGILDYSYYLPRIDKVVLDKSQDFQVIQGISRIGPSIPADTETGMSLYILTYPPYTANSSDINRQYINNRRYTMKDIGGIDRRVSSLEYYTSLSLLEQGALNKNDLSMRDSENLTRFKNGILVDNFTGTSVVDVLNKDYDNGNTPKYSIDPRLRELRPSFTTSAHTLEFDSANSSGYIQSGPIVSANGSDILLIDQPRASRWINVNPFNVVNYIGKIVLNPDSDFWVDTASAPEVVADVSGDLDAWRLMAQNAAHTEWGSWNRVAGTIESATFDTGQQWQESRITRGAWGRGVEITTDTFVNSTTVTTGTESREGIATFATMEKVTKSLGNLVVDMSIIPYMRNVNVLFIASDFRPNTTLYPFFDGKIVDKYVSSANRFTLTTNNIQLRTTVGNPELVYIKNSSGTIKGSGYAIHAANNVLYVANLEAIDNWSFVKSGGATIVGAVTGGTYAISNFEHNSGQAIAGSTTTVTLSVTASGANNYTDYVGKTIFITTGTGAGQQGTVTAYNVSTRVATVSGLTTAPAGDSVYTIGRPTTDASGCIAGVFSIPGQQFRIGEKLFRLIDNIAGDIPTSRTNGDASFFSQGLLQTKQSTSIVATTATGTNRRTVRDERPFFDLQTGVRTVGSVSNWVDPLAETFLISPQQFAQGVFVSRMRFCFKSKDATIPVTLQVRPVVNGYPSSADVYPYSTVSLTPDKVKITNSPDITDPNKYTEFVFPTPLFLQPGEHAFVLLANSNEYEVYAAEIGKKDLVTGRQISEQPYGGSMFLSQNGSTWTADQNLDLQFQIWRRRFNSDENAQLLFQVVSPDDAQNYDLAQLITQHVTTTNTSINYTFNSQTLTESYTGYQAIIPHTDYNMNDGFGTRQLVPTAGNTTFLLKSLMSTVNPDISPFIDTTKMGFIGVNNVVDNLELSNDDIQITSAGSGYTSTANVILTISGGGGTGATASCNVANGQITNVWIVDAGEGYTGKPTVTIQDIGGLPSSNAVITITGETDKSGGPAAAKYITRKVVLAEGFDSGDLRVYLTAYKPADTGIFVYAKYLSSSDSESWDDKGWNLLTQLGNANFVSSAPNDYRELTFSPGTNGIADNAITYTNGSGSAFNTFKTFAIKIVMTGKQTYDVVKIRDLRVIAMPAKVV